MAMGLFPQKNLLVFLAYFIRIAKRNNFVEEIFQIQPFFVEKTQFENSKITVVPFFAPKTEETGSVVVKN
jgi:hypothetical protein